MFIDVVIFIKHLASLLHTRYRNYSEEKGTRKVVVKYQGLVGVVHSKVLNILNWKNYQMTLNCRTLLERHTASPVNLSKCPKAQKSEVSPKLCCCFRSPSHSGICAGTTRSCPWLKIFLDIKKPKDKKEIELKQV